MNKSTAPVLLICSFKNEEVAAPVFIAELIDDLDSSNLSYRLILVDDGSTDKTSALLQKFTCANVKLLILNRNIGKIAAQAVGARKFSDDNSDVIFFDGDGQHHPSEIRKVLEHGQRDSRIKVGQRDNQYKRRVFSRIGTLFLKFLFRLLGIRISIQSSELVYLPSNKRAAILADSNFGFLPINLLLPDDDLDLIPIRIHPRINSDANQEITRHENSDLIRKGLIQIYSKPLEMLYRLFILGAIPVLGIFCYGMYVGVTSLYKDGPTGVGSIIVILSFSTITLLMLGIISFGFLIVINEWLRSRTAIESELK